MKRNLPVRIMVLLMFALRFLYAGFASASHTMGADLTYQCIGGNTYKISLSFYRDCIGIAAPANPFVTITSASCGQSLGVTCYPRPGTGQEVTPTCSSAVTTCQGGSFTGIQEWVYDGIITLPMQCADWRFGYSLCCRNAAITTITTPSTSTFYIYATLNNTVSPCNSSPIFSNKPVPFVCLGQQFCFNHGAYDADGDSLTYQLITPLQTATIPVTYLSPYNASNPLNSSPVTSFSSTTGDICITPQALEVTVMAVLVKEYRNGILIGTVERDLQLTVMSCNNNLPSLSGINGTNNFNMTVCANQPACFDIFSNDPDNGQNLSVNWNNGIAGATFTVDSGARPTSHFCWTPSSSDIGRSFTFTATVRDDACPYRGSQTYSYTINVVGISARTGPDQAIACSDLATLTAIASGGGPYTYSWSNGSNMQSITVGEGTYVVTASNGSCVAFDTVAVTMPFTPQAAFTNSSTVCSNSPISFTDQSSTPGGSIWLWYWDFGDGSTSLQQNPIHTFPGSGTYNISLIIENTLGCRDTVTNSITIAGPPQAGFSWTGNCVGNTITFRDSTIGNSSSWFWDFGNGTSSTQQNPTITFPSAGTFTVTLITNGQQGCPDTVSQSITILPLPNINAGADQFVCSGRAVTISASGGQSYSWSNGQTTGSFSFSPTGSTTLVVNGTDANGCINSDTIQVSVLPLPNVSAGPDRSLCIGSSVTLSAVGASSYSWIPAAGTGTSITVNPTTSTTYTVIGTDANGCTASDVIEISVNALPSVNAGPDVQVCEGATTTLSGSGTGNLMWSPGGSTSDLITINPLSSTTYTLTATDGNGCSASDFAQVRVINRPVVNLTSFFLCAGSNATLNAGNSGSDFLWNTGDTTQLINISAGGIYSVMVTNEFGCTGSASCNISYGTSLTINLGNVSFCEGDSVILDAGYPGMNYSWTPGGQTTQSITINTPGNYGVTVTDPSGCSGSINVTAVMNPLPNPNFGAASVCEGSLMNFTNGTTITSGSISGYLWNFGNGTSSAITNPIVDFLTAGTYNVNLTATSNHGCSSSVTNPVIVNPNPIVAFNAANGCEGAVISFTDQSSISTGNIINYSWDFGDGNVATTKNPSHIFSNAGNYNVSLTVTTAGGCSATTTRSVTISPVPQPAFTTNSVCQGNNTTFINTSTIYTGTISSFTWSINGTTTTLENPDYTFNQSGVYTIQLTATSNEGCSASATNSITVWAAPTVDAGNDQSICRGGNVTLSASGAINYLWSTGETSSTISIAPNSTTTYSVIGTNGNGCSTSDNITVSVRNAPSILAGPDQFICQGQSTTLTVSGNHSFSWIPGGMTGNSITVSPDATTSYIVTGTANNGCSNSDTIVVTVYPKPIVIAGPDVSICSGSTVSLAASGASSYLWNPVGGLTSSVLITPSVTSSFVVIGTDTNGCSNSDTVNVVVNPVPVLNLTPAIVCLGSTASLDAGNQGSVFAWSTGETSQIINVSDSGTYSVIVTNPFGCSVLGNYVVALGGTTANVPSLVSICDGQSATLTAGSNPGNSYLWSTGSTSSSIQVTTAGNYYVTITDAAGCAATLIHRVSVNPVPQPSFSGSPDCFGLPMHFTNGTTSSNSNVNYWLWNFGDNTTSSLQEPSHNYSSPGSYTVSLTATTSAGCSASISELVTIHPKPVASFSAPNVCAGTILNFTQLSNVSSGSILETNWSFGDNTTAILNEPSHLYSTEGSYMVSLIVTSDQGCTDTASMQVSVNPIPDVTISTSNVCQGTPVHFSGSSLSSVGITNYHWDLGNGATASSASALETYNQQGTYQITLQVTDANGCSNEASETLVIYPNPTASFSTIPVCSNSEIPIDNLSEITTGSISSSFWSFSNGIMSNEFEPAITISSAGTFSVDLIVSSDHGCRDTATGSVTVYPLPLVNFSNTDICLGSATNFTNTSSFSSGSIAGYNWNFGDNMSSALNSPVHQYANSGTYSVTLTAMTSNGCSDSISHAVNVFPNPDANFTSANVCQGSLTQLVNQSYLAGGGSFTTDWSFSDGGISNATNPVYQFNNPGNYDATLIITSAQGCIDSITGTLTIYRNPVTRFASSDGCVGSGIQFTDMSYSIDGNINVWAWNFGDGGTSNEGNPSHTYSADGMYNVSLTTTSIFGCRSSFLDSIDVFSLPPVSIQSENACVNTPVQLQNTSVLTNGVTYTWDLGNGTTSSAANPSPLYTSAGNYSVTLIANSGNGCTNSANANIIIYPAPSVQFSANEVCRSSQTSFQNNSSIASGTINLYEWNFGDGISSNQSSPVHTYSADGMYTATLTATSDNGCVSTTTQSIRVNPVPVIDFSGTYRGCSPLNANFINNSSLSSGSITGYLWDFGDGSVSNEITPEHIFQQSGLFNVTLTAVSDRGCYSSLTVPGLVRVLPSPTADFTADPMTTDMINPVVHFENQSINYQSYLWTFSDGFSTSTETNPVHAFADTGIYTAQLLTVNSFGCRDSIMKSIEVRPRSTLFLPNCFSPNGDGTNDVFKPEFTNMKDVEIWVYDRWGKLLSYWNTLDGSWDGYYGGRKCQTDTYVYKVIGNGIDGKHSEWVGHVSIIY